jgi:hypothetical protein
MSHSKHRQIWTKVNAPVDEGVAELVSLLNSFPNVQTVESCQGTDKSAACVWFLCGKPADLQNFDKNNWREIARFVCEVLGPSLVKEMGDGVDLTLRFREWGPVMGELSVRHGWMEQTLTNLKGLLHQAS